MVVLHADADYIVLPGRGRHELRVSAFPSGKESGGTLNKHLYILLVTAIDYENRSKRLPRGSNRDKKRKRKLP